MKTSNIVWTFSIFFHFTHRTMSSEAADQRVVYQTFSLPDGDSVECYGQCMRGKGANKKINISRCDGQKIRIRCRHGLVLNIRSSWLGKLSPDIDICNVGGPNLQCKKDVTQNVRAECNGKQRCVVDVTNGPIRAQCGDVRDIAMDVRYLCQRDTATSPPRFTTLATAKTSKTRLVSTIPSIKTVTTLRPMITTASTKTRHSTLKIFRNIRHSLRHTTLSRNRPTFPGYTTTPEDENDGTSVARRQEGSGSFLILAARSVLFDSDTIKNHKGELALVFLLSTFVGVVVFMFIYLDYCRRAKKKHRHSPNKYFDEKRSFVGETMERIELNAKIPCMVNKLVNQKCNTCRGCNNNNNNKLHDDIEEECEEEDEGDVYANISVATPFLKRNYDGNLPSMTDTVQGRTSSQSAPIDDVRHPRHSATEEILPPPVGFNSGEEKCHHCTTSSRPHTMTSYISDTSIGEQDQVDTLRRPCSHQCSLVGQNASFDGLNHLNERNNCNAPNPMDCHMSDTYASPTKYGSGNKRPMSMAPSRGKCTGNCECKPPTGRMRSTSVNQMQSQRNSKISSKQNNKRSRVRTMQRCDENMPSYNFKQQKGICSDNETMRRKRRCVSEFKRGGRGAIRRDHGNSLSDIPCRCRKSSTASSNFNCCSSITSNGQSSHEEDEDFEDAERGPSSLLSIPKDHFKKDNELRCVEESGYQTRDTGTDSLCSSSLSTDQEDNRMFLPASLHNTTHSSCKSKTCRMRHGNQCIQNNHGNGHRHHNNLRACEMNKSKISRRSRRNSYTDPGVHQHKCTSVDVPSYDSSLEDDCMRPNEAMSKHVSHNGCASDVETRRKNIELETRCSCVHSPAVGVEGTVDNID